jgi:hypothetical protein
MSDRESLQTLSAEVAQQGQFLRSELGFRAETPGNLRRTVEENQRMLRDIEQTLRGTGDELGLVGWMTVLRRTWITLVALLGAAGGYLLNDVVDAVRPIAPREAEAHSRGRRPAEEVRLKLVSPERGDNRPTGSRPWLCAIAASRLTRNDWRLS